MIGGSPPAPTARRLPPGAEFARRWIRNALRRLPGAAAGAHRPDFSMAAILRALSSAGTGKATHGQPQAASDDALLQAARQARALFGPRFFVAPESIPSLWHRLRRQHPDWCRPLMQRTEADAVVGIPLYGTTGPMLGGDFTWSRLPQGPGADVLYPLRPHRFAFAPRTALACLYDERAAARLHATLESWIAAASGADRHCYASNLTVIQRVLALSWCWAFLAARPLTPDAHGGALELRVLAVLLADAAFLESRLGRSTPNNHLLADRFAGWYLRTVFPEFLRRADTGDESAWRHELLAQTYPDGGSFEHSAHYHEFACEMGAAYLLLCRRARRDPDRELVTRIGALLHFQLGLTGPAATPLVLGNGTEDAMFPLDTGEGWCAGALRELYRALFDTAASPAPSDDISVSRAYWLLGGDLAPAAPLPHATEPSSFPDGGLYVQSDSARAARLVVRTGPPPEVAVAAGHMHADLLGIYFSAAREPLLVDAGTYSYRRSSPGPGGRAPDWRAYFAGPAAHNGLTIAGFDPLGELHHDFRPSRTATRALARRKAGGRLDLVDATLRAPAPYGGVRRACIHVRADYWLIVDIPPPGLPEAATAWYGFQCAPGVRIAVDGRRTTITGPAGGTLSLSASAGLAAPQVLEGSLAPLGGWVSPAYGAMVPAPQLRYPIGREPAPSAFVLAVDAAPAAWPQLDIERLAPGAVLARVRRGEIEDLFVLDSRAERDAPLRHAGICCDGHLSWLRLRAGRPLALQWFDGSRFSSETHGVAIELAVPRRGDLVVDDVSPPAMAASSFRRFDWPAAPSPARS